MLAIFLLMLDHLDLRLILPRILGSKLFVGMGLDWLRNSSPPWLLSFWSPDVCGGVYWRPLPRFAPIDRPGPCMVAEPPALSALVRQSRNTRFFVPQCRWALLLPP
jgi:hypothetical protein